MTAPGSPSAAVVAAIITCHGRVLLVRRRIAEGDLSWQFPAGKVEPGESAEDAVRRETREETGLAVTVARPLGQRIHPLTGRTMLYFACDIVDGNAHVAAPDEIAEVAWCDRATLSSHVPYPLFPPVQEHLDALLH